MHWSLWCLFIGAGALALTLLTSLICFLMVFYSKKRVPLGPDEYEIPPGEIYEAFREDMVEWTKKIRSMPHEDMEITSFDGLKLRAKYYEYEAGAPIEILFHGYKGYAERDLSGGVERCFRLGRNVILVDQRASGSSDGHVITFGIREYRDCHSWVRYAIERFGEDVKLIIGGVSMGAATVMMAAGEPLPKNVIGVLADCGYTSPKEIICKVVKDMKLPPEGHAPVAYVVICADKGVVPTAETFEKDVGICAQTIMLAASEDGFGGCMLGSFTSDAVKELLELNENLVPKLVLALGKPDERVELVDEAPDGSVTYSRDGGIHYVQKRKLENILIQK